MVELPELVKVITKIKNSVLVDNLADTFGVKVVNNANTNKLFYLFDKTIYANVAAEPNSRVLYEDTVKEKLMYLLAEINLDHLAKLEELTEEYKSLYANTLTELGYLTITLILTEYQKKIMRNLKNELEQSLNNLNQKDEEELRKALFNATEHNFTADELKLIQINFNSKRSKNTVEMFKENSGIYVIELNVKPNHYNENSELSVKDIAELIEVQFMFIQEIAKIKYLMVNNKDVFDGEIDEVVNTYLAPDEESLITNESIEIIAKYSKL